MDENQETHENSKAKKGGGGRIVGIVVGIIVLISSSAIGTLFGAKFLGGKGVAEAAPAKPAAGEDDPAHKIVSVEFDPIVMDLRDGRDGMHHLKVGLAVELADKVTPDEFHAIMPRGREAVISYLRSLSFEEVSKADLFEKIRGEIADSVTKAVGEHRVSRVLVVDFVAQ